MLLLSNELWLMYSIKQLSKHIMTFDHNIYKFIKVVNTRLKMLQLIYIITLE